MPASRVPNLDYYRETFLTAIIEEIGSYFPEGTLKPFAILNPKNIPSTHAQALLYGLADIHYLAERFYLDPAITTSEWTHVMTQLITSSEFCRLREAEAIYFWQHYLKHQVAMG